VLAHRFGLVQQLPPSWHLFVACVVQLACGVLPMQVQRERTVRVCQRMVHPRTARFLPFLKFNHSKHVMRGSCKVSVIMKRPGLATACGHAQP
jgi:hypothetical protein